MPELLTRVELCRLLKISITGLEKLLFHPTHPLPHYRAGRKFLFDPKEILDFIRVHHSAPRKVAR